MRELGSAHDGKRARMLTACAGWTVDGCCEPGSAGQQRGDMASRAAALMAALRNLCLQISQPGEPDSSLSKSQLPHCLDRPVFSDLLPPRCRESLHCQPTFPFWVPLNCIQGNQFDLHWGAERHMLHHHCLMLPGKFFAIWHRCILFEVIYSS